MTDIIELIDNAIEDSIGPDAMRWAPEKPATRRNTPESVAREMAAIVGLFRRPQPTPPRQRVIDEHRDGYRLVPFIGGPWDRDVRRLPMDTGYAWNVAEPPPLTFDPDRFMEIGYVTYTVRRIWLSMGAQEFFELYAPWRGDALVCVIGDLHDGMLNDYIDSALLAGWRPWLYPTR